MQIGIDDVSQECLECSQPCSNRRSLGNHVARSHKHLGGLEGYVLKHFLKGNPPKCLCGCGKDTAWKKTIYTFGNYVNGHNPAGFRAKQPKFTQEQIGARNKAIRESYADKTRGKQIRDKISKQVKKTFATPEGKQVLSEARKKMWHDPEMHAKLSESRRKTWESQHDDLIEKIFTPEFKQKISIANSKRTCTNKSKKEQEFCDCLQSAGFQIETSKWFNFSTKTWCADVWLPEHNTIVEFDGTFWHGRDRTSDWSDKQLESMANDLVKNRLAIDKSLTLIRIDESVDASRVSSYEELCDVAYHFVWKGEVIKEGSPKLDDSQVIISRDRLLNKHVQGHKLETEKSTLLALKKFVKAYVAYWGWFYPECTSSLEKTLNDLVENARERKEFSSDSRIGSAYLKSIYRSFWNVCDGPVESTNNDRILNKVLRYRLGLNSSRDYTYTLSDGKTIVSNEHFDVSLAQIRKGLIVNKTSVSWFKPQIAADIWLSLLGETQNPVVWDPSVGFGARLLGFMAVYPEGFYNGTEPSTMIHEDVGRFTSLCRESDVSVSFEVFKQGSEHALPIEDSSVDAVFTSPPYFDLERYFNEPGQCWRDHASLESWVKEYLLPTFVNAHRVLKPNKLMAININRDLRDVVVAAAQEAGFALKDEWKIMLRADAFMRKSKKHEQRSEPLLVFEKQEF